MFYYFFLFYSMIVTQEKHNLNLFNMSWKIPVFIFCHSPYCSICNGIHPSWVNLSKKYENDPKIMVAEIDCNSHDSICSNSYKVKSYPNFVQIIKGIAKKVSAGHDFESLESDVNELLGLKMNELCKTYPSNDVNYPALVFSLKKNKVDSCTFVDDILKKIDLSVSSQIYANDNQTEESLYAYINKDNKIPMNLPFTTENILNFIQEFKTPNFAIVKWSEAINKNRTTLIVVVSDQNQLKPFNILANDNSIHYYWASITTKKYYELSGYTITESETPALIYGQKTKNNYCLITNINETTILQKIENEEYCSSGTIINKKMNNVFHDYLLFPGKSQNFRRGVIILVTCIALVIIYYALCYSNEPTLKFE